MVTWLRQKFQRPNQICPVFLKNTVPNSIFLNPVDDNEASELLSNLNISKSCWPNSIPSKILKMHSDVLLNPIKDMLNESLSSGTFPNILKTAQVCTVLKKGEPNLWENYRPISLLSNLSKLFERSMHTRIYSFLDSTKSFDLQFGIRKNTPHPMHYHRWNSRKFR